MTVCAHSIESYHATINKRGEHGIPYLHDEGDELGEEEEERHDRDDDIEVGETGMRRKVSLYACVSTHW